MFKYPVWSTQETVSYFWIIVVKAIMSPLTFGALVLSSTELGAQVGLSILFFGSTIIWLIQAKIVENILKRTNQSYDVFMGAMSLLFLVGFADLITLPYMIFNFLFMCYHQRRIYKKHGWWLIGSAPFNYRLLEACTDERIEAWKERDKKLNGG